MKPVNCTPSMGVLSPMTYREKLNGLRQQAKLSVVKLAKKAGIPVSTVNSYLIRGDNNQLPSLLNAVKLARALGVSMAEFDDCSDWPNPDNSSTSDKSS